LINCVSEISNKSEHRLSDTNKSVGDWRGGERERERERVKKGEEKPSVCGELLGFVDLSAEIKERFF
jgi:hypothetical protein